MSKKISVLVLVLGGGGGGAGGGAGGGCRGFILFFFCHIKYDERRTLK